MPGSCDSEQSSSPSLISSLRRFRFQNKSKQSQPAETSAHSSSGSSDQPAKNAERSSSQKLSSTAYNPLSYRKYENPKDSLVLLQNIHGKISVCFKKDTTNSVLDLVLTTEETKKLKDTVLLQASISVKWATNVTEYDAKDSDGKLLKIKRLFMHELSKYISGVLNNKFAKNSSAKVPETKPIRTYSRAQRSENTINQSTLNNTMSSEDHTQVTMDHTQVAMDDYEEFCEKEQCLRKLLDAFPGADIMEAQDILVKCQWDLSKAMVEAQSQPLKTTRKRGFSGTFIQQPQIASNLANQRPVVAQPNLNIPKKVPEEIVLDSSDEDEINGNTGTANDASNQTLRPAKRARRLISTDSEDEGVAPSKSPVNTSYQKPQLTVMPSSQKTSSSLQSAVPQKTSTSQQLTVAQKVNSSVQSSVPQKTSTSQQLTVAQKVNSSLQSSVLQKTTPSVQPSQKPSSSLQSPVPQKTATSSVQPVISQKSSSSVQPSISQKPSSSGQPTPVRTSSNQSNSLENINIPQALSIKPVPVSSVSNEKPASSPIPGLPKGLVITQVGSADSLQKKSENEGVSVNGSHSVNIPSNSNKQAQLIRVKPTVGVSVSSNTTVQSTSASVTSNTTANATIANIPMGKGMSITPVNQTVNMVPKTTPKALSITPVSSSKEPLVKDKSDKSPLMSSTEDESSSDIKSKPRTQTYTNASQHLEESNDANQSTDKSEKRKHDGKRIPGKRKRFSSDEEDEEEYGNEDIYDSEDSDCEENLTSAHSAVLKFFQESSAEELGTIPGCSKKKIEAVLNLRPFTKWLDLVDKLKNDKTLSTDLLNGAKKVLDMRNAITKLMTKCQRISLDMGDLVENLKENQETCSGYVSKQPELLNERMHLTSYQMLGLNWLLLMHNREVNAILADEMGLGKTVQAISFLAYLKQIEDEGPHLIVVPSSTLDNWRKELKTWWPSVSVICYHGQQESRRELRMQVLNDEVEEFDIMITTYNMVTSSAEDRSFFKRLEFNYVVFDEAHMLKNMASQRYANLMRIKAPRRLLLTGTPLQNNLVELMSLLIFAMPDMFSGKIEQIKQMFSCVSKATGNKNTYEKDRIEHAKHIMKPFVLRRLKKDVLKELPNKHDETRFCPMVEDQAEKYDALIKQFSAEVQVESTEEKDSSSSSGAGMMMQLRRAANHPLLLRRIFDDDKLLMMSQLMLKEPTHDQSDPNIIFEEMSMMSDFELHKLCLQYKSLKPYVLSDSVILNSGKFKVLDELLPDLIKQDHRILLFSQFTMVLDIVQDYMNIKEYKYLRLDGQVPVPERQQLIDDFNNDPEILVFLLSTRAGGLGINLTAADTVILHDIDFNPYNDKQAEDRCHRVGQVRDVRVIRLISEKTIEEGILQRAKEKLKLERDIHDEGDDEENDTASVAMLLRDALGLKSTKS